LDFDFIGFYIFTSSDQFVWFSFGLDPGFSQFGFRSVFQVGFLSVWIQVFPSLCFSVGFSQFGFRSVFLDLFGFFFRFGFSGFVLSALRFQLSRIICALQQYKDATAFTLPIAYSTGVVNPSIFGIFMSINRFNAG
jgi:hypothetical protein